MTGIAGGARKLAESMKADHGDFSLFALMLPEDSGGRWDLVMSAPWLGDGLSDYEMVAARMKKAMSPAEASAIARIVILGKESFAFRGGSVSPSWLGEMWDFTFNGVPIRKAYIIESSAARLASVPSHRSKKKRRASNGRG